MKKIILFLLLVIPFEIAVTQEESFPEGLLYEVIDEQGNYEEIQNNYDNEIHRI
jgi:hypothetical protein